MRRTRAGSSNGTLHTRLLAGLPLSGRGWAVRGLALLVVGWALVSFTQEAWAARQLNDEVARARTRNAQLQAENDRYTRDIAAVQSGGAAEEVARSNGYARPDEKVYVIASPPAATPAAQPPKVTVQGGDGPAPGFFGWIASFWNRFRR